jgi:hypothetical protein
MNQRVWLLGILLLGLAGCAHQQTRLQAEDESEREKVPELKNIGAISSVANAEAKQVSGVGLVVGLDGTGGGAPPGGYRAMLEDQLRKGKVPVENLKEVLASSSTSLVLISAMVPPGARRGDPLDLQITVPRESRTTSLRGGQLIECVLADYDTTKNIAPNSKGADQLLTGHKVVKAEGAVLVGFGDGDESVRLRQGCIWGGGRLQVDRPLYLILNNDQQYSRLAQAIADRINETFSGAFRGPGTEIAVAKTKAVVLLGVPSQYKLNLPRYLRVVRLIPLEQTPSTRIAYRKHLEEQLLDPAHTVTAALRLEALGANECEAALKRGLTSSHPLVRFCSAEALAYLDVASCGEELARSVKEQPALRAYSLTALASLDQAVCHVELRKLLEEASPETRYGAFRALRALDEHEEAIQGDHLNQTFWLHHVAPASPPLIHIATHNRAEVVLFGEDALLIPPFPILAGEFTITANRQDDHCIVSHTSLHGNSKRQCSLKVEEVLHAMADLGATYADVIEFLRRADRLQCLSCKVAVDALPQATSVYELAKAGAGDPEALQTHPEILQAKDEFNATPTLFEKGNGRAGQ